MHQFKFVFVSHFTLHVWHDVGSVLDAGAAAGTVDGVHEVFLVTPNCETQKT